MTFSTTFWFEHFFEDFFEAFFRTFPLLFKLKTLLADEENDAVQEGRVRDSGQTDN